MLKKSIVSIILAIITILSMATVTAFMTKTAGETVYATENASGETVYETENSTGEMVYETENASGETVYETENTSGETVNAAENSAGETIYATEFATDADSHVAECLAEADEEAVDSAKIGLSDYGPKPYLIKMPQLAKENPNYRTAIWTGEKLQATLMSIPKHGEVGVEIHEDTDQFFYVVEGSGTFFMGPQQDNLDYSMPIGKGSAIFIPLGTWHNIVNNGCGSLKLFSIYAPPHHPHGTVHTTKAVADAEEH